MAIANLTLPSFPMFTLDDDTTISTRWKKYKRRFENMVFCIKRYRWYAKECLVT